MVEVTCTAHRIVNISIINFKYLLQVLTEQRGWRFLLGGGSLAKCANCFFCHDWSFIGVVNQWCGGKFDCGSVPQKKVSGRKNEGTEMINVISAYFGYCTI